MKKAQIILAVCGVAVLALVLVFVELTGITFSALWANIIIIASLCCFMAALVLRIIAKFRDGRLPFVSIGVAIGILIVIIQRITM